MNGKRVNNKVIVYLGFALIILVFIFLFGYIRPYKINFKSHSIERVFDPIKILVVGDMMLDRNVRRIIDKKGFNYFFSGVKNLIGNADITVANLEGPFTTYQSVTIDPKNKDLVFTFDPALVAMLADFGFDVLGLANNHTLNFGTIGLEMTRKYIGASSMYYYGDPNNKSEIGTIIIKKGIKVGFVGFHEFSYINFDKVLEEISRLRPDVDVLIVTPHWGVEYDEKPTALQIKLAHQFIDLGVDAVIGTHSHIIGDIEEYKGKKIYYSLGNFAFDQYFSKDTMNGLGVIIDVKKENGKVELNYTDIPIQIDTKGVRIKN